MGYNLSTRLEFNDTYYESDLALMEAAGVKTTGSAYWLGSRAYVRMLSNMSSYFARSVTASGELTELIREEELIRYDYLGGTQPTLQSKGVRPVITLKDDVIIISGEGTEENPWILGIE